MCSRLNIPYLTALSRTTDNFSLSVKKRDGVYVSLDRIIIDRENPGRANHRWFPYPVPIFGLEYPPNAALTERLQTLLRNRAEFGNVLFRHYKLFHFEMGQMEL